MALRQLTKDSAIYGGVDLLSKTLSFFTFPIIAASLSPNAFGVLELISTVIALLSLVMNCGLNNSVQRFYWDKDTLTEMQPSIVTSGLYAQLAFGFITMAFGLASIPIVLPRMQESEWPITWIAMVSALAVTTFSQWSQYALDVIRLHFAPWRFFFLAILSRIATTSLGLVAVIVLGLGIDGLLAAQALSLMLVMPLALWMIRKDLRPASFSWIWFKELVHFGYPFIYAGLAYWLFGSMDRWMLASMTSVAEVGIYSVAFRFASVVLFMSAAFGQAWSPAAIKIRSEYPDTYRLIYGQVLLALVFVMLAVGGGLALFSGEIIILIMPMEYLPSALPLTILCFGMLLQATQQVTAIGISIAKKTYIFARLAWTTAIINLVSNLFFIPHLGASGAALATSFSFCVLTLSYLYYTQILHPLMIDWKKILFFTVYGFLILCFSVVFTAKELDLPLILAKTTILLAGLGIGWHLLPIRSK